MAHRPKARKKQRSQKGTDKKQSEQFRKTARELGADVSLEDFEKIFLKIVPPKRREEK